MKKSIFIIFGIIMQCYPLFLFDKYPTLSSIIPHVSLLSTPSPVAYCKALSIRLYGNKRARAQSLSRKGPLNYHIYCKDDGDNWESGKFTGNKVRKLEFLLGDALKKGATTIETTGGVGSNHTTCTAAYAQQLGLKCCVYLKDQPNSQIVRRNLLLMHDYKTEMTLMPDDWDYTLPQSSYYQIPLGATNTLGCLGYVNAAFELKEQIDQGELPEPDIIYLTLGTGGSVAGLALGLKLSGLKSIIMAVKVGDIASHQLVENLFTKTNKWLHNIDPTIPLFKCDNVNVREEFFEGTYGLFTARGKEALSYADIHADLRLDGTYTGNTMAALIHDAQFNTTYKNILFWNTFCEDINSANQDYTKLKPCFHKYFECSIHPKNK